MAGQSNAANARPEMAGEKSLIARAARLVNNGASGGGWEREGGRERERERERACDAQGARDPRLIPNYAAAPRARYSALCSATYTHNNREGFLAAGSSSSLVLPTEGITNYYCHYRLNRNE